MIRRPQAWVLLAFFVGIAGVATAYLGWRQDAETQRLLNEAALKSAGHIREIEQVRGLLAASPESRDEAHERIVAFAASFQGELAATLADTAQCLADPSCVEVEERLDASRAGLVDHLATTQASGKDLLRAARRLGITGVLLILTGLLMLALSLTRTLRRLERVDEVDEDRPTPAEPVPQRALEELLRARLEELYSTRLRVWESERFSAYGELAAGLHHGLKTPLASVRAAAQVAQSKLDHDHPAMANLDDIINEVDGLVEQIKRFLQAAGHGEPVPARLEVGSILAVLEESYAESAAEHGVSWETRVGDDLGAVSVDPALLEVALRNIVENALAVAPRDSTLSLSAAESSPPDRAGLDNAPPDPGSWIEIRVADEGPGLPRDVVAGGRVESSKPNGSGLGLAIARRIVARHGGTLLFDLEAESGTHVRILLPVAEP